MISYIVSVYDRTKSLNACLATLDVQEGKKEVLVCCNSTSQTIVLECQRICLRYEVNLRLTGFDGAHGCYESADMTAPLAKGEWLCFPSDDSLYVEDFSRIMLQTASSTKADLVYCDCLYKAGSDKSSLWPSYTVMNVEPRLERIDKTCFILRRELFKGFPPHRMDWRDGQLINDLVAQGVRHAKAPRVLCVHQ